MTDDRLSALLRDPKVQEAFERWPATPCGGRDPRKPEWEPEEECWPDGTECFKHKQEFKRQVVSAILAADAALRADVGLPKVEYRTVEFAEAKRLLEEMAPVVEKACAALERAKHITQKDLEFEVTI